MATLHTTSGPTSMGDPNHQTGALGEDYLRAKLRTFALWLDKGTTQFDSIDWHIFGYWILESRCRSPKFWTPDGDFAKPTLIIQYQKIERDPPFVAWHDLLGHVYWGSTDEIWSAAVDPAGAMLSAPRDDGTIQTNRVLHVRKELLHREWIGLAQAMYDRLRAKGAI